MKTYQIRYEVRKQGATRQTIKTVHIVANCAGDARHLVEASEATNLANLWFIDTVLLPTGTITLIREQVTVY